MILLILFPIRNKFDGNDRMTGEKKKWKKKDIRFLDFSKIQERNISSVSSRYKFTKKFRRPLARQKFEYFSPPQEEMLESQRGV